ncbi:hypothetical protein Q8F55_001772 [Vanrija albida]|uniref:Uncharacterized protein n=1 Tax=Vanrija albida TaxID=181172 RepID=A0ABR3Q7W4_9TREE
MPPVPITFSLGAGTHSVAGKHGGKFISFKIRPNDTLERGPSSPAPPAPPSANQKRKAGISAHALAASASLLPDAAGAKLSTPMTPLNVTIVARCLARGTEPSSPPSSANRKRTSGNHTPATSPAPTSVALHAVHPYSRASDLANTRSTVPSPQEILRAERAEEEKARQKKENAAAARLAAALARRRKAQRNGSRSASQRVQSASVAPPTMIPATVRAITTASHGRSKSADPKDESDAPAITMEPASLGASPILRGGTALKRTRSSGIHGINTNLTPGAVSIASPLRSVAHAAEGDDDVKPDASPNSDNSDGPARKRTRLSSVSPRAASTRRANTTSPLASPSALEGEATAPAAAGDASRPTRRAGALEPSEPTASAMRRVVSATEGAGRRNTSRRTSSVGLEPAERLRREVQVPARMRDYAP